MKDWQEIAPVIVTVDMLRLREKPNAPAFMSVTSCRTIVAPKVYGRSQREAIKYFSSIQRDAGNAGYVRFPCQPSASSLRADASFNPSFGRLIANKRHEPIQKSGPRV